MEAVLQGLSGCLIPTGRQQALSLLLMVMMSILKISAFFALCVMLVIGLIACGDDDNTGSSRGAG
jgi:hypothetical protein